MRRRIFVISLIFMFVTSTAFSAPSYMKDRADRVTVWNKFTDSLATIGKDASEKRRIKRLRRAKRQQSRLRKARTKASKKRMIKLGVVEDDSKWWPF